MTRKGFTRGPWLTQGRSGRFFNDCFNWWMEHQWVPLVLVARWGRAGAWLIYNVGTSRRIWAGRWDRFTLRMRGYPRSWLKEAERRGARCAADGSISGSEFARVGIAIINGCPGCGATVAPYNSYMVKPDDPYAWCEDCVGIEAHGGAGLFAIKLWTLAGLLLLAVLGCKPPTEPELDCAPPGPEAEWCHHLDNDVVRGDSLLVLPPQIPCDSIYPPKPEECQ